MLCDGRRVSPTSFYPLLTRAPSDEQARLLVAHWLTNASRFCVAPAETKVQQP